MRQKAAPIFPAHEKLMKKNFDSFEVRVKREIRKLEKGRKPAIERQAEASFAEWRSNGSRLPQTLNVPKDKDGKEIKPPLGLIGGRDEKDSTFFSDLRTIHADFLAKQTKIDNKLEFDLIELSSVYINGLKIQLDKLTRAKDFPAAEKIQAEIASTQGKPQYFSKLMRGIDPNPPPEPVADAKANAKTKSDVNAIPK